MDVDGESKARYSLVAAAAHRLGQQHNRRGACMYTCMRIRVQHVNCSNATPFDTRFGDCRRLCIWHRTQAFFQASARVTVCTWVERMCRFGARWRGAGVIMITAKRGVGELGHCTAVGIDMRVQAVCKRCGLHDHRCVPSSSPCAPRAGARAKPRRAACWMPGFRPGG